MAKLIYGEPFYCDARCTLRPAGPEGGPITHVVISRDKLADVVQLPISLQAPPKWMRGVQEGDMCVGNLLVPAGAAAAIAAWSARAAEDAAAHAAKAASDMAAEDVRAIAAQAADGGRIAGIEELRAALADEEDYRSSLRRMMEDGGNDGARPPRRPTADPTELARRYPRAAAFLRAEATSRAAHHERAAAGRRAMKLLADGGTIEAADAEMNNWLSREAHWH